MRLLLVHGMGRTPLSLTRLARFLRQAGHRPESLGYMAAIESFDRIRRRVRQRLEALSRAREPYAVIGHSLGGLALRAAVSGLEPGPQHLIMLATPNQLPRLARRLHRLWPYRLACGESGQLLAREEFFAQLPLPRVPYTIIAGSAGPCGPRSPFGSDANDWLVAVEETKINPTDRPTIVPVGHTFMMNDSRVHAAIRRALEQAAAEPTVSFRPLTQADLPLLHEWLNRPHVTEWWTGPPTLAEVEQEFGPLLGNQSTTRPYVAIVEGAPIGYIQSYVAMGSGDGWWPDEQDPGVRGIDQFLAHPNQLGRGLGTAMVRAFMQRLFSDPAVTRIQTDPSPRNSRAIRCYEKAGFRAVGEVDTPNGLALLMVCDRLERRPMQGR
jgi:aminoglycoside 6'-N-acetyltransferase Ib